MGEGRGEGSTKQATVASQESISFESPAKNCHSTTVMSLRRSSTTFAVSILLLCFAGSTLVLPGQSQADLERGFADPPAAARPRTLWMWMNGNVTTNGITLDLEAMRRVGLGGALIFNAGESIPKGPVEYGGKAWLELMTHAVREADRLGLELAMHNGPGWSSSGGPWITPELSMQQLVWSETRVTGQKNITLNLPQPFTRLNYYRDVCVLAFPSLPGDERPFSELLTSVTNG